MKETVQISAPSGTSGNWDAHVFSLPFAPIVADQFYAGAERNAGVAYGYGTSTTGLAGPWYATDGAPTFIPGDNRSIFQSLVLGLLNVHSWTTSGIGGMLPNRSTAWTPPASTQVLGTSAALGRRRLIAAAYEIHDTTAQLYKQGTLTAYRMPQAPTLCNSRGGTPFTVGGSAASLYTKPFESYVSASDAPTYSSANVVPMVTYEEYNTPPPNPSLALEYAGSRQWEVKDGAYVVLTQDAERNALSFTKSGHVAMTDGDYNPSSVTVDNATGYPFEALYNPSFNPVLAGHGDGTASTAGPVCTTNGGYPFLSVPFHTGGVMLTGLNAQSTFTVTLRTVWELAPVTGDFVTANTGLSNVIPTLNPLVPMAQPSPEYDPIALELYQRAVTKLPVAVPVGMNAAGDFWDWVLGAVQTVAPMIGTALGGAPGTAVGGLASKWAAGIQERRNKRDVARDKHYGVEGAEDIQAFKPNARPKPTNPAVSQSKKGKAKGLSPQDVIAKLKSEFPRPPGMDKASYKAVIDGMASRQ